jgi:hypothetical protein
MASIIQTVLLVAGPLAGIWLGSRLTRSAAERQWRRYRCLEAYTDVVRGCQLLLMKASQLYITPEVHAQFLHENLALYHAIKEPFYYHRIN